MTELDATTADLAGITVVDPDPAKPWPLTKRSYPVAWELGDLVLWAKLALETGRHDDGHKFLFRWNGFVGPAFTRENVERYRLWADRQPAGHLYSTIEWDGDVAVVHDPSYPDDPPERLSPTGPEGRYYLGEGWTWQIVEGEL